MRFCDKYQKVMNQKSLSEDFIQNLCSKMTDSANQDEQKHKNKTEKADQTQILETHAIEYTEKKNIKKYSYLIASAAALFLICVAAVNTTRKKENLVIPPKDNITSSSVQVQTKTTVLTNGSDLSVVTDGSDVTTAERQTIKQNAAFTTQDPYRVNGKFGTPDELMEFINLRKASLSPVDIGYKEAGIQELFGDFYDVTCSDTSYSYSIKDADLFKYSPLCYSLYDEAGEVSQINSSLSCEELEQFNRIFSQIDKEAGQGNYYIYDVYKFSYYNKAQSDPDGGFFNPESVNYRVEIVLNDYYSEYLDNTCRDNAVISYEIRNDLGYNSDLTSEYQYFINEENKANEFYSEFTEKFTDCAITIGNVDTQNSGTKIYRPFTTWFRPADIENQRYRYNIAALTNACYLPEKDGTPGTDEPVYIYACLFFKPGTDPDDINSKLTEMKPVFDKYNVLCVTVDILKDESDFNSFKNGNGFGDEDIVNSSYRRYCATYSDEFPEWSAK